MKKLGHLLFAVVAVALLSSNGFAQRGGGHDGGGDTTILHKLDSLMHLHHDSLPPNPHDSLGSKDTSDNDHDGDGLGSKDTTGHGGRDSVEHHGWGGRDTSKHGGGGGFGSGNHNRIDIGRLLRSDSCLLDLEAQMSAADVAALNAALAALKNDRTQIQTLQQTLQTELKTLRQATPIDTAAIHAALNAFRTAIQPILLDVQNQTKTIGTILANYQTQIQAVWATCTHPLPPHHRGTGQTGDSTLHLMVMPLFPNPVSIANGAAQTTLQYSISMDAPVNITLIDQKGNTLQQIANGQEVAGPHTATISLAGLQTGMYYVRVQAGAVVQTDKLVIMN